jgi:crotonyl-CoA reductase
MTTLTDAVAAGAPASELARCPLPATYRAADVRKSDVGMFGESDDKDVRKAVAVPRRADDLPWGVARRRPG